MSNPGSRPSGRVRFAVHKHPEERVSVINQIESPSGSQSEAVDPEPWVDAGYTRSTSSIQDTLSNLESINGKLLRQQEVLTSKVSELQARLTYSEAPPDWGNRSFRNSRERRTVSSGERDFATPSRHRQTSRLSTPTPPSTNKSSRKVSTSALSNSTARSSRGPHSNRKLKDYDASGDVSVEDSGPLQPTDLFSNLQTQGKNAQSVNSSPPVLPEASQPIPKKSRQSVNIGRSNGPCGSGVNSVEVPNLRLSASAENSHHQSHPGPLSARVAEADGNRSRSKNASFQQRSLVGLATHRSFDRRIRSRSRQSTNALDSSSSNSRRPQSARLSEGVRNGDQCLSARSRMALCKAVGETGGPLTIASKSMRGKFRPSPSWGVASCSFSESSHHNKSRVQSKHVLDHQCSIADRRNNSQVLAKQPDWMEIAGNLFKAIKQSKISDQSLLTLHIEHCIDCPRHRQVSWHDERRYIEQADMVAKCGSIILSLSPAQILINHPELMPRPRPRLGSLEVTVHWYSPKGKHFCFLLSSKLSKGKFVDPLPSFQPLLAVFPHFKGKNATAVTEMLEASVLEELNGACSAYQPSQDWSFGRLNYVAWRSSLALSRLQQSGLDFVTEPSSERAVHPGASPVLGESAITVTVPSNVNSDGSNSNKEELMSRRTVVFQDDAHMQDENDSSSSSMLQQDAHAVDRTSQAAISDEQSEQHPIPVSSSKASTQESDGSGSLDDLKQESSEDQNTISLSAGSHQDTDSQEKQSAHLSADVQPEQNSDHSALAMHKIDVRVVAQLGPGLSRKSSISICILVGDTLSSPDSHMDAALQQAAPNVWVGKAKGPISLENLQEQTVRVKHASWGNVPALLQLTEGSFQRVVQIPCS